MKVCYVVLIVALLINAHMEVGAQDWVNQLTRQIDDMNFNIQRQVQQFNRNLNAQIQRSLQPALAEVDKAIRNIPKDAQGRVITHGNIITNGNIIRTTSVNGLTKTITSGHTADGEPYVRNVEERNEGNYLYHNEIYFNPRTNATEKIRWKLDLTVPNATPEIITDEM